ncbi:unnamed protein product, partial [Mesorhabditis spiculigera]
MENEVRRWLTDSIGPYTQAAVYSLFDAVVKLGEPTRFFFAGIQPDAKREFVVLGSFFFVVLMSVVLLIVLSCLSLYALSLWNWFTVSFSLLDILLFSSLISAVDPVAVIAIFEEINVNAFLFVNVFGEALFNDGVTVVLYNLFNSFQALGAENLITRDYLAGGLSFFVVAIGGIIVGVVFAFLASFVTKYSEELRAMATVFVFVVPYVSYLTAEWWAVSSIIAIAVCGMVMKQYVKGNLSQAANSSVKYFTKVLAQSSETVIFVFLGLSLLSSAFYWDTWFVVATLVFCLIYRTIGVVVQCAFLNRFRAKKFTAVDQFILSYGGLRGAIAYGLAVSMPEIKAKDMFVTTTIAVIYFTVFLQGSTVRPLVKLFKIKIEEHRMPTMAESVYNKYLDYMMSGVEDIIGRKGHYTINENYERFNAKVLKPLLMRNQKKSDFDATKILRAYAKITLEEAMTMSQAKPTAKVYPDKRIEHLKRQDASMPRLAVPSFKFEPTPQQKISQANMDQLYSMFSDLLDHKLRELQVVSRSSSVHGDHDEIEDDYMKQIAHSNQHMQISRSLSQPDDGRVRSEGSRANLSQMANLSTDLEAQISRRRSTGNVFDLARKD